MRDCVSPSMACAVHALRTSFLDVAPNGQDYAPHGRAFQPLVSYRPPVLMSISPTSGPSAGGTMLTLRGLHNLSDGSDYRCRFNRTSPTNGGATAIFMNATVFASFDASSGFVRCVTPRLSERSVTLAATVFVSLNGQQYHSAADAEAAELAVGAPSERAAGADSSFAYLGAPSVTAISPTCGPTYGQTNLTLTGVHLQGGSDYRCRFGASRYLVNASTLAHLDSASGTVHCLTPRGMDDLPSLHLELSLNGQESTNDGTVVVRYRPAALYSFSPSSGPISGDTLIRVGGNHSIAIDHGCDVRCKFARAAEQSGSRSIIVQGTLVATETGVVHCTSPAGVGSGPLEISLNGQQYTDSAVRLDTYSTPSLVEVSPPLGPSSGNTSLRLTVTNLSDVGSDVRCRFSSATSSGDPDDVLAVIDPREPSSILTCTTPPHRPIGVDELRITLNGQQFSDPLSYFVLAPPMISTIYPLTTPERGGIVVTIYGDGFGIESGAQSFEPQLLRCKFGMTSVVATLLNHTAVTCIVPTTDESGLSARRAVTFDESTFLQVEDAAGNRAIQFEEEGLSLLGDAMLQDGATSPTPHISRTRVCLRWALEQLHSTDRFLKQFR